jgi:hypothetical protein
MYHRIGTIIVHIHTIDAYLPAKSRSMRGKLCEGRSNTIGAIALEVGLIGILV